MKLELKRKRAGRVSRPFFLRTWLILRLQQSQPGADRFRPRLKLRCLSFAAQFPEYCSVLVERLKQERRRRRSIQRFLLRLLLLRRILIEDGESKFVERVGVDKLFTRDIELGERAKSEQGFLLMNGKRLLVERFGFYEFFLRRIDVRELVEIVCHQLMFGTERSRPDLQRALVERGRVREAFLLRIQRGQIIEGPGNSG